MAHWPRSSSRLRMQRGGWLSQCDKYLWVNIQWTQGQHQPPKQKSCQHLSRKRLRPWRVQMELVGGATGRGQSAHGVFDVASQTTQCCLETRVETNTKAKSWSRPEKKTLLPSKKIFKLEQHLQWSSFETGALCCMPDLWHLAWPRIETHNRSVITNCWFQFPFSLSHLGCHICENVISIDSLLTSPIVSSHYNSTRISRLKEKIFYAFWYVSKHSFTYFIWDV